jgi:hypothetical protein
LDFRRPVTSSWRAAATLASAASGSGRWRQVSDDEWRAVDGRDRVDDMTVCSPVTQVAGRAMVAAALRRFDRGRCGNIAAVGGAQVFSRPHLSRMHSFSAAGTKRQELKGRSP